MGRPPVSEGANLRGVFPILATCFGADGAIDYGSQERLIEFCIEGGVHGLVTLANASEGHLMSDVEKQELLSFVLQRVEGRVPVIVTVNHPSALHAGQAAAHAEGEGASAVMALPPFFGRWRAGPGEIVAHFGALDEAVSIPIVLQDHALSDIQMSTDFIVDLARRCQHLTHVKLESGNIIHKARSFGEAIGGPLTGVFGGNSGIFLPEEMEAGCCGTMPACYMPDVFRRTWDLIQAGHADQALDFFAPFSRLAAYEKEVSNRCVWKRLLVERGVIASDAVREPTPGFATDWQKGQLLRVARHAGLFDL
ncbi:MAG: dihydrodipicolinate synthase family protein [Gemmatimonadetes bacterium]|jgi:2-keto-3-deoxy-L-arabinonate dehydratase|nr:dihydrodipicolinate synthase family protein [Gemmatimonadota bacterium]MBT6148215.1 dihydrodipicolinate synthase family protein [Gemmatimonadota bacterium]MBT7864085.1 dihydrodipicolinate synthase family protein [Gemmatimonadota bacterium]